MLHRRNFLTALGLGAGSLMLPSLARAADGDAPKRLLLLYSAQGTVPWNWSTNPTNSPTGSVWSAPTQGWAETDWSPILQPLHPWRDKVSVVEGLSLVSAEADGSAYRHERAQVHSLTGANVAWVAGFPYASAPTIDQLIANQIARPDRYRSIELSVSNGLAYDGYGSVIYAGRNQPLPPIDDPRKLWERLFGFTDTTGNPVFANQGSVLDAVAQRYDAVAARLSSEDRLKLEAHRDLVRSLEMQVQGLASASCSVPTKPTEYGSYDPDFLQHVQLATLALSCDLTRVVSIQMGQLQTQQLGAPPGDVHGEWAHGIYDNPTAAQVMTEYGRLHAAHFTQILAALDAIPEGSGTLLDNTLVLWMSEMADSWHGFDRYPVVVGGGGGILKLGQWVHYPRDTPFAGLQYDPDPSMGRPHQRLLTSVANGFGLGLSGMPVTEIRGDDGSKIDCTGVLPELMA